MCDDPNCAGFIPNMYGQGNPTVQLKFVFLPKRSAHSRKFLWLTHAYRKSYRTLDFWYSQKEYVWLKLKGELV